MPARSAAAKSYAKALFELAREADRVEPVGQELERVRDLVAAQPDLRAFLSRPWVGAAAKRTVVEELAGRLEVSKLVRDFFAMLAARARVDQLDAITHAYRDFVDDHLGRARARVRTLVPLTDDERRILAGRLSRGELMGHRVELVGGLPIADRVECGRIVVGCGTDLAVAGATGCGEPKQR